MADSGLEVNLRVLSQLAEPYDSFLIGPLRASCSVAELKQKIRDLLPSTPPPERQRLIYRGRPLTRDTDTLLAIIGDDVARLGERQTLHLVLREPHLQRDGQTQTAPRSITPLVPTLAPFQPGGPQEARQSSQPILQQTPFATDQARRQSPPNPALVAQQMQQAHLAQMRQNFPHLLGHPLPVPHQMPGDVHGNHPLAFQQHPFFPPALQPGTHGHPFPVPHHPQPAQPGQPGQPFPYVPGAVYHFRPPPPPPPSEPPPPESPPPPPPPFPNDDSNNLAQPVLAADSQSDSQAGGTARNRPTTAINQDSAPRNVTIHADDPQAAMLNYMEGLYTSMGVAPQERERLRGEMVRNAAQGRQLAGGAGLEQTSGPNVTPNAERPSGIQVQPQDNAASIPNSTATRHGVLPNGHRWSMTINASAMPFPPQPGLPPFLQPPNLPIGFGPMPMPGVPVPMPNFPPQQAVAYGWSGPRDAIHAMQTIQNALNLLADHRPVTPNVELGHPLSRMHAPRSPLERLTAVQSLVRERNSRQSIVNAVLSGEPPGSATGIRAAHVTTLQSLNDEFRRQANTLTRDLERSIAGHIQPTSTQPTSMPTPTPTVTATSSRAEGPSQSSQSQGNVVAYLLSSPTGPHAIVYTPQGTFTSARQPLVFHAVTNTLTTQPIALPAGPGHVHPVRQVFDSPAALPNAVPPGDAPAPPPAALQQQLILQQPFRPLQQAQAPNVDDNGLVIALTPFFRTVWFFTRVLAFFWLFGGIGGSAFRRILIVTAMSIVYHFYQVGAFRDQQAWLLQRWENLIGVQEVARPAPATAQVPGAGPLDQADMQRLQGNLQPQEAARRLINDRRQRDRGWLRARIRVVERAVALFIASLYPGVGERHVAERERVLREAEQERNRVAAAAAVAADPGNANTAGDLASESTGSNTAAPPDRQQQSAGSTGEEGHGKRATSPEPSAIGALQTADTNAEGSSSSVAVREDSGGQLTERRRVEQ